MGLFLCSFQYLSILQCFDEQFVINIQLALLVRVILEECALGYAFKGETYMWSLIYFMIIIYEMF